MLRIILAEPFGLALHMMPLILTFFGLVLGSNGPAAIPFDSQPAIASVICAGKSNALAALVLLVGCRCGPQQPMSAPCLKSEQIAASRFLSGYPVCHANSVSLSGSTHDLPIVAKLEGNLDQKWAPGSRL
jgi:hypothetical protein